ncbi:hypothetical protein BE21_01835 [Sorangium cellulosum]|uniref:Uncharacterized protein n=1 Tax=Sorangium cellulosum TaxID=56 RepID=A0A150TW62_SORCE|nr:hypothetical protein BE21_01835 [Sorangium cellulosum]
MTWAELEPQVRARLDGRVESRIIDKMIETMQNSGDAGKLLGDRIANGQFNGVEGYVTLIKKASTDRHSIEAINQTMDRASQVVRDGVPESQLRFEHDEGTGTHDVDVGVRNPGAPGTYLQAYQFKTLNGRLTPKKIQEAAIQLRDVNAVEKILELRCTPDTTPAVIESPKMIGEMRYQAGLKVPGQGNGITEFRFELSDGTVIVKKKADLSATQ